MKINLAELEDSREILKLLNNSKELQTTYGKLDYDLNWVKSVIVNKKLCLYLVAKEKNEIAGALISYLFPAAKESFTIDLIVKKKFRGKGIAIKLNKEYEKTLKKRGFNEVYIFVLTHNKKMQKLKTKLNYKKGKKFYFYRKDLK